MVNKNSSELWAESLNSLVITYFKNNLSTYTLVSKTSYGPYWGVKYSEKDIEIRIGGDVGFSIEIIIDNIEYKLWQFDRTVNNSAETNEKNVLYQLEVLKRFLKE